MLASMWAMPAAAELRELSQSDLRNAVANRQALPSRSVMSGVENYTGGTVLEIRAFEDSGVVTYRVLFRDTAGAVGAIMIDGASGRAVQPSSSTGQSISGYVSQHAASPGNGRSAAAVTRSNGNNNRANGNSNRANGNANSDRGRSNGGTGRDRGNSGGNGNGSGRGNK